MVFIPLSRDGRRLLAETFSQSMLFTLHCTSIFPPIYDGSTKSINKVVDLRLLLLRTTRSRGTRDRSEMYKSKVNLEFGRIFQIDAKLAPTKVRSMHTLRSFITFQQLGAQGWNFISVVCSGTSQLPSQCQVFLLTSMQQQQINVELGFAAESVFSASW